MSDDKKWLKVISHGKDHLTCEVGGGVNDLGDKFFVVLTLQFHVFNVLGIYFQGAFVSKAYSLHLGAKATDESLPTAIPSVSDQLVCLGPWYPFEWMVRSLSFLQLLHGLPLRLLPWGFHQRARSVGPLAYPRPFSVNDLLFHRYLSKPHFCSRCPCAIDIVYAGFEGFRTFRYVFMSVG